MVIACQARKHGEVRGARFVETGQQTIDGT